MIISDTQSMRFMNFNGEISPPGTVIFTTENRAFRYGDGIFESIRLSDHGIPLLQSHCSRLLRGAALLSLSLPDSFSPAFLSHQIAITTGGIPHARVRFCIFRSNGGLYRPADDRTQWVLEADSLEEAAFPIHRNGIVAGICPYPLLTDHYTSAVKTCNRLPSVLAAQYARQMMLDDCIMLHTSGSMASFSSGNIFFIQEQQLITPPLTSGCIDGVMRRLLLQLAPDLGFQVIEKDIRPVDLRTMDEVFLTNAIRGIVPVRRLGDRDFIIDKSSVLLSALNDFIRT